MDDGGNVFNADEDEFCDDVDSCPYDADNDSDGDGLCGAVDSCPDLMQICD